MLVQGNHRLVATAGRHKPINAGVVWIEEQPRRETHNMGRPNIDHAAMTGYRNPLSRVVGDDLF